MPKLWSQTVESHRQAVRDATLDAAADLVSRRGLASVTMSQVAEEAGIGRATLYKYFSDIDAIMLAWHERQVANHLAHLNQVSNQSHSAAERLTAVLMAYAGLARHQNDSELGALLHSGPHMAPAYQDLHRFVAGLIAEGVAEGALRDDVPVDELAEYCLHALLAVSGGSSQASIDRLVKVAVSGLRPSGD